MIEATFAWKDAKDGGPPRNRTRQKEAAQLSWNYSCVVASVLVAKGLPNGRASLYPARWWAHMVGALRVDPHKHYANYPPQKDRRDAGGSARVEIFWPPRTRVPIVPLAAVISGRRSSPQGVSPRLRAGGRSSGRFGRICPSKCVLAIGSSPVERTRFTSFLIVLSCEPFRPPRGHSTAAHSSPAPSAERLGLLQNCRSPRSATS